MYPFGYNNIPSLIFSWHHDPPDHLHVPIQGTRSFHNDPERSMIEASGRPTLRQTPGDTPACYKRGNAFGLDSRAWTYRERAGERYHCASNDSQCLRSEQKVYRRASELLSTDRTIEGIGRSGSLLRARQSSCNYAGSVEREICFHVGRKSSTPIYSNFSSGVALDTGHDYYSTSLVSYCSIIFTER